MMFRLVAHSIMPTMRLLFVIREESSAVPVVAPSPIAA